jgi:hypothetical protein
MACIRRESPEVLLVDETCIVDGANDSIARLEKEKKKKTTTRSLSESRSSAKIQNESPTT